MNYYKKENFIWNVFQINYENVNILVSDDLKQKNNWLSLNTLLILSNSNWEINEEIVVRVVDVANMPQDTQNISSLIEIYRDKDEDEDFDITTKKMLSSTAYKCKILWTIFKDQWKIKFGSDLSNIYNPFSYKVYKPSWKELEELIKLSAGFEGEDNVNWLEKYWIVRYASSVKLDEQKELNLSTPFYINSSDILARRTALFWMTRTGKSNSIKKLIQTVENLNKEDRTIWQIIFDINWEYANTNEQDWTSIYEKYQNKVKRFSFLEKPMFQLMKVDFFDSNYGWLKEWFELIKLLLEEGTSKADYFQSFLNIDFEEPEVWDYWAKVRYERLIALYKVILYTAWFQINTLEKIKFDWFEELDNLINIDTKKHLSFDDAKRWFIELWKRYKDLETVTKYPEKNNWKEWASEELKSLLVILTWAKTPGSEKSVSWYKKLEPLKHYHSPNQSELFYVSILRELNRWNLVIVDLSQWDPKVKKMYVERLTKEIFNYNLKKFINWENLNYFQLYFEESHNLFPKQDTDLTQIYNRLAKEWAKYKIWLVYATQEVSAISPSILKNTENWFISHLNNDSEISYLNSFYDFKDYSKTLKQFSKNSDLWYSRIKMLSYPFTVPVQIDLFK